MITRKHSCMLGAVLLAMLAGTPARAQDALGDGRGLNRELGNAPRVERRSFREEVALRNAIVTGNAPGGLSFRGSTGYTAAGDFRGRLGSDDLFAFRRDTAVSSAVSTRGLRGTDGLRYQFAFTGGTTRSGRDPIASPISRLGPGPTSARASRDADREPLPSGSSLLVQPAGGFGTLRSTSAYGMSRSLSPAKIGFRAEQDGMLREVSASGLRGVTAGPRFDPLGIEPSPDERKPDASVIQRPELRSRTAYDQLIDRLDGTTRAKDPGKEPDAPGRPGAEDPAGEAKDPEPRTGVIDWRQRMDALAKTLAEAEEGTKGTVSEEDIRTIRGAGIRVDELIERMPDGSASRDVFGEHIARGQQALTAGRYFDAEERFALAADMRPDDTTALVGRLHAQLGAGMYKSASFNLRALAKGNPEMLATRYAPELLPTASRQETLLAELREFIQPRDVANTDLAMKREAGLLLAYLGYQRGEPDLVRQGIQAMEATAERVGGDDTPLATLLRGVWVPEAP